MRTIIHSKTLGTYLDHNFAGFFFSSEPFILTHAATFQNEVKAKEFVQSFMNDVGKTDFPNDLEFLQVDTEAEKASMDECVAAGVQPWKVDHVTRIEPFHLEEFMGRLEICPVPSLSGVNRAIAARTAQIDRDISPTEKVSFEY